jgi:hypothetical protein
MLLMLGRFVLVEAEVGTAEKGAVVAEIELFSFAFLTLLGRWKLVVYRLFPGLGYFSCNPGMKPHAIKNRRLSGTPSKCHELCLFLDMNW